MSYYFDEEIGIYTFKKGHPMRPLRMKITDELIDVYGLKSQMQCSDSLALDMPDTIFYNFHSEEYIDLLKNINDDTFPLYQDQFTRFGFSADCPVPSNSKFYDFCKLYTTGSVYQANLLNDRASDITINWSGGLHHAKRQEASGFCYINDCVLAIIELLKVYDRVLYIDIDCHHGDGVEEAFLTTNRVMTCSFHKYKDFFPGTGNYDDIGFEKGKYHSVNFPLSEGIDDITYEQIFVPLIDNILEKFNPSAIVLQCGTDSLSGDKLGCFNLSVAGHGNCVKYIKGKNIPLMLLGGGGYTLRNIARAWTYETSVALGVEIPNEIPENCFQDYFYPENKIHTAVSNMENTNKKEDLHFILNYLQDNLKKIERYSPTIRVEHQYEANGLSTHINEKRDLKREEQENLSESQRASINC